MPRLQHDNILRQGSSVSIYLDGEPIEAISGDSIAAALIASGKSVFNRDKSGRPRGLFCGMGACFECQVSVDGGPAQRACLTKVEAGMKIRSLAYRMETGAPGSKSQQHLFETLECDVLIVGAGPAGITAAIELAKAGISVIVVDERAAVGGQFFKQISSSFSFAADALLDSQYRDGATLIDKLNRTSARIISQGTVWGAFRESDNCTDVRVATRSKSYSIRPGQLILATGAFESTPAFPGWTLPGVMTTGAAQGLVRAHRVAPGQRVLIAGNGPLNLQLACELIAGGTEVLAVAESAAKPFPRRWMATIGALTSAPDLVLRGIGYLGILRKHGVPVHYEHHILSADGDRQIDSASLARIGDDGRMLATTARKYDVDTVCVGYRLQPSNEIARTLGCKHEVAASRLLRPVCDENGQSSIPGVFVIGDSGVLGGAHVAMAEGRLAAQAVLGNIDSRISVSRRKDRLSLRRQRRFQSNLWKIYSAPDVKPALPETPVCRCELVSLHTIKTLIENGVHDLASLKRQSRAGMGKCQGRYCQNQIATILGETTGRFPRAEELFAPEQPVKPVAISRIAAEKPEWLGYRTVDMPNPTTTTKQQRHLPAKTNVLVIGAGIIGITTALYLAREGIEVILVDRNVANGQASGRNAGSLHLQLLSFDFSDDKGTSTSPPAAALPLQQMGVHAWCELQQDIGADFGLEITGGLVVAESDRDLEFLRRKAAVERKQGIDVEIMSYSDLRKAEPSVAEGMAGAAYCAGEGKINPMLATPQILAEAIKSGARIFEQTTVTGINRDNGNYLVSTNNGTIRCRNVVNAAGGWAANIASMIGVAIPVKTAPQQMIVTEPAGTKIHHLLALAKRHLTMKQASNGNIIIGGGWPAAYQSASGRAVTIADSLEGNLWAAQRILPEIGSLQMIRSWATIGVMIDGAPVLGELPGYPRFYNAVGANGYTMGPMLGQITAGLIRTGQPMVDIQPFLIDRFSDSSDGAVN